MIKWLLSGWKQAQKDEEMKCCSILHGHGKVCGWQWNDESWDLPRRIYFEWRQQLQKGINRPSDKYEPLLKSFSRFDMNWSRWGCKVMCCAVSARGEFGSSASISDLKLFSAPARPRHFWTAFKQNSPRDAFGTIRHTFFPSASNTQFLPPTRFHVVMKKVFWEL